MTEERLHLTTDDQHDIGIHYWPATGEKSLGALVWLHGMAEHGGRYGALAGHLNQLGWHLYCPDHRGHGLSINDKTPKGHFADAHGWECVINDACRVIEWVRERHSQQSCVLGGHSMGSFIALGTAEQVGDKLDGLILCGSDYHPGLYYRMMQLPIRMVRMKNGKRGISGLLHKMTFGTWAKQVVDPSTDFDWLSADPQQVKLYIEDDLCGFDCTTETWLQLVQGLRQVHSVAQLSDLPETLPVLLVGGEADPMSNMGKGMMALENVLHAMEQPVEAHFWPEGRHEILNDLCRDEVQGVIASWLGKRVA
ncbi:alpha/beta fold hydrolase [Alcanivorax sediminis]|uniref:Alpha/beta fold hydrolase n=1 Tax=Alcanivorax sediminis TaxID=2663008 RepID=A0A6N7LZS6_9GAMM|nr:alpha/beta fold hydrolase [Alcanivorax sediminis]MQX53741.1 alpha/beta fold hydrolase [Alcanivorax sediminis]